MDFYLSQQVKRSFSLHSNTGGEAGLYRDTKGWILFLKKNLWIGFYLLAKAIIFVRLFPFRNVFALVYVPFEKRRPAVGFFKLHRLLYFIRAVFYPSPTECCQNVGVG